MRGTLFVLVLLATGVAGCGDPPGDADPAFEWQIALADLDDATLAVCGDSNRLYVVGGSSDRGRVLAHEDGAWSAPLLPAETGVLWWCWQAGDGTVFAVGERGTVLRRDSAGWTAIDTTGVIAGDAVLYGVWGTSAANLWLVGARIVGPATEAVIAHYDSGQLSAVSASALPPRALFKVWGASAADVWAVGDGGTALHYEGSVWSPVTTPAGDRLIAVWGSGASDVFAVGGSGSGVVLRWDGASWSELHRSAEELSGVWTGPGQALYVGGARGYLARYRRGADGRVDPALITTRVPINDVDVHSLFGAGPRVVAVGSDLLGGNSTRWRGAVLAHGAALGDHITLDPTPDAGLVDATSPDGSGADGGADAGADAGDLPGKGEECLTEPPFCASGLECWGLMQTGIFICTETCTDASECVGYGTACCNRPGIQTLETTCIPTIYAECT